MGPRWIAGSSPISTAQAFEEVARETAKKFTDDVIEQAVRRLPDEWQTLSADLSSSLRARRGLLADYVMHYYRDLAKDVDVHATDKDEVVSIRRLEGGVVDVSVSLVGAEPYFERRFLPSETNEVRVYLHGGKDRVERSGPKGGSILVRVIAGQGDDVVDDSKSGGTDVWSGGGALAIHKGRGTGTHPEWRNPEPDTTALWLEPGTGDAGPCWRLRSRTEAIWVSFRRSPSSNRTGDSALCPRPSDSTCPWPGPRA
jgi:hypothetical protein